MNPSGDTRGSDRVRAKAAVRARRPATGQPGERGDAQLLRIFLWTARLLLAGALAFAVSYVPYHLYLRSGLAHFVGLRRELTELQARNQKLRGDVIELRLQLERFQENREAVERVAREELGFLRSGEVVFKVE
jgi:cell division protein FtsB